MSEKIINEIDNTNDQTLVSKLKSKINDWSNSLPHHPYKNFGDKIEVKSLLYTPTYPIVMTTQYEKRTKNEEFIPYDNRKIPKRKYWKLDDIKVWDWTLESISEFLDKDYDFYATGSQYIEDCHRCNASGYINCIQCHGDRHITCPECVRTGKITCSSCSGTGKEQCTKCKGRGHIEYENTCSTCGGSCVIQRTPTERASCSNCGGTGRKRTSQQCSSCHGTGRKTCNNCGGSGKVTCPQCGGNGVVTCPKCHGSGKNTCPTCNGQKQLMHYINIKQSFTTNKDVKAMLHDTVFDSFPEFKENWDDYESEVIFEKQQDKILIEDLPEDTGFNTVFEEFITNADSLVDESEKILFQNIQILKIKTWTLNYSFKGKEYTFAFHSSNQTLIPGNNPISEYSAKMINKGTSSAKSRSYVKAYKLMNKSQDLDVYEQKTTVQHNLSILRDKIAEPYFLGAKLGGLLAALIFGFIAYVYFSDVNLILPFAKFINKPTNWLYGLHPWIMAIAVSWLILKSRETSGKIADKIFGLTSFAILRLALGFVTAIISSAVIFGLVALLNFISMTIILTIIGFIIWWIIKIFLFIIAAGISLIIWIFGKVF